MGVVKLRWTLILCSLALSVSGQQKDAIGDALREVYKQGHFVGFSAAVVREKGIVYETGIGMADAERQQPYSANTLQNIGSISKTLVGIAVLKAQELGKIKLDDPIDKYLPFAVRNPFHPESAITIRQLTNHTSTITDNAHYLQNNYILKPGQELKGLPLTLDDEQRFNSPDSIISMEQYFRNVLTPTGKWYATEDFLENAPGQKFAYSNVATALAAFVVERATGMPFEAFTQKYILRPLKMEASGWHIDDVDATRHARLYHIPGQPLPFYALITYPDGNFITSAHDLGLFLQELIKGYGGHGKLLSKESYRTYFKPALTAAHFEKRNEKNPFSDEYNVGVFIGMSVAGNIGHTGGDPGVTTMMFFDPKTRIGSLLIVNTNLNDKKANDEFWGLWKTLQTFPPKP